MKKILVIHGPNLNMLGLREQAVYGKKTLSCINEELEREASLAGFFLSAVQSNNEGQIIDYIQDALRDGVDYMIVNPAAYTHTSIAMRDALLSVNIPFIEVHISNIYARESYRSQSYFSDIAEGIITGFGTDGYLLALQAILIISRRESI